MAKFNTTTFDEGGNDTYVQLTDHGSNPSPTAGKLHANTTSLYWEGEDLTGGGGETITKKGSQQLANTTGLLDITESACTSVNLIVTSNTTLDGTYFSKHTITGTSQFGGVLINSDASNTSTTMTDSSISGHTITKGGHVNHRTDAGTPYKFPKVTAETSIYFDGTGDYLQLPVANDLKLQNDDFTIETWVYLPSVAASVENIIANWEGSGGTDRALVLQKETTGAVTFTANHTGDTTLFSITSGTLLSATTWHHLVATRQGNTLRLFIDGVLQGEDTASSTNQINDSTNSILIGSGWASGASSVEGSYTGYMDGIRILKGYAAYTSNFAVPTRPYTNHEFPFSIDTKAKYCGQGTNQTSSDVGATVRMGNDSTGSGAAKISIGDAFNVNSTAYSIPILFENSASGHNHIHYNAWTEVWGNTEFSSAAAFGIGHLGTRGVFGGGETPSKTDTIDYITIGTANADAVDFGDLSASKSAMGTASNGTRGVFAGGDDPPEINVIEYITIGSTGNATDFGDLTVARQAVTGASNGYRGLFAGGSAPTGVQIVMDYITIATTGNAVDFGGLLSILSANRGGSSMSNNSRAVFPIGTYSAPASRGMDFVTIASIGSNALDFGELSQNRAGMASTDDGSRGVMSGGNVPPLVDTIDYIAIGTPATASDFGNLVSVTYGAAAVSNGSRGVIAGGEVPAKSDKMDYISIGTLGNAADFNTGSQGEITQARAHTSGLSGT